MRANQELLERGAALCDERDRRLAKELVSGTLRNLATLDAALEDLSGVALERIDGHLLGPLRIGLYQILHLDRIPPSAAVNESVKLARSTSGTRGAGFVNAVLRKAVNGRDRLRAMPDQGLDAAALALQFSVPEWIVARWLDRWGQDETHDLLRSMSRPSPVSLWVNPALGTAEELARELREEGIETRESERIPHCLHVVKGNPATSRCFSEGKGYLQDEGSQAIALLMPVQAGMTILDACAAPGGKSFILASRTGAGGKVIAVDRAVPRLRRLLHNRARLKIDNVFPLAADMERRPPFSSAFDAVILDAPCTGTGVMGRHPEIRWRLDPGDLVSLVARQRNLLQSTAAAVAPGGVLLYSVCSLEPEEGEEQIDWFVEAHPEFETVSLLPFLPILASDALGEGDSVCFLPHRHRTDGFFAALLRRKAS
ncbi:MAG TPA: 16S rRNA (cytosine(967)-C(5))-methyltransferase RsmB [Candidatus Polarisedimenticolia bacterium]|nr:16S rRNA (cytosine(967)-C(5))-methyltransferase RsmB [Candidatus Polarisedimenticolia bacterium]